MRKREGCEGHPSLSASPCAFRIRSRSGRSRISVLRIAIFLPMWPSSSGSSSLMSSGDMATENPSNLRSPLSKSTFSSTPTASQQGPNHVIFRSSLIASHKNNMARFGRRMDTPNIGVVYKSRSAYVSPAVRIECGRKRWMKTRFTRKIVCTES